MKYSIILAAALSLAGGLAWAEGNGAPSGDGDGGPVGALDRDGRGGGEPGGGAGLVQGLWPGAQHHGARLARRDAGQVEKEIGGFVATEGDSRATVGQGMKASAMRMSRRPWGEIVSTARAAVNRR